MFAYLSLEYVAGDVHRELSAHFLLQQLHGHTHTSDTSTQILFVFDLENPITQKL